MPNTFYFRAHGFLAGLPDFIGCHNGRFFGLEVKTSAKAPRAKLQEYIIGKINKAGGYACFVYPENMDEVFDGFDN